MTQYLLANTPDDLSQAARLVHLRLIETGLDPHLATALVRRAIKRGGDLETALRDEISRAVPVGGGIESGAGQQVIALVGPTGVGKTTTCAKLAANLTLSERRSVALISADAFRVGGAHQLGFYAEILEVPFHSAHDRKSLLAAIRACGGAEIVLVDTTGRSGSDGEGVRSVGEMLDADPRVQRWLTLSAVASTVDNLGALRTFNRVRPSGLVLTKFDESHAHGAVTTVAIRSNLPLRYVTDGQTVPDDHEVADRDLLPRLLLEGTGR